MRLQRPQNGSLTGAMMPISPRPSGNLHRLAVDEGFVGGHRAQVKSGLELCHGHFGGVLVAAGRFVRGGMTFTEPSALTSTLRS